MEEDKRLIRVCEVEHPGQYRYQLVIGNKVIVTDGTLRECSIALEQWEAAHGK